MCVDSCLLVFTGLQVWWKCGGVTPAVSAAIAPAAYDEPMSMKLERVGESCSLIVPTQALHQLVLRSVAAKYVTKVDVSCALKNK